MSDAAGRGRRRPGRALVVAAAALLTVTLVWWLVGRAVADTRRVEVHRRPGVEASIASSDSTLRILAWNVAHGRGDAGPGLFRNWAGGSGEERVRRLEAIADVIEEADADVVVLNEVDFRSSWSGGLNQAEALARTAGYPVRVEQTNYDVRLPFAAFVFGNAVLSRRPVLEARRLEIPPHRRIESALVGAKRASVVRVETVLGPVAVVPVHLEVRSDRTRLGAVPVFRQLRAHETAPLVLAGDFNSAPPGWPGAGDSTAVGRLLELGWSSPRTRGAASSEELTFPTTDLRRAIDWVLVEPPLRVLEARVLEGAGGLSDHAPVLAVVGWERRASAEEGLRLGVGQGPEGVDRQRRAPGELERVERRHDQGQDPAPLPVVEEPPAGEEVRQGGDGDADPDQGGQGAREDAGRDRPAEHAQHPEAREEPEEDEGQEEVDEAGEDLEPAQDSNVSSHGLVSLPSSARFPRFP